MDYALHILILFGIYAILAMSLNVAAGYTGLLSIAHAAVFGVGAYVGALMAVGWHTPFLLNIGCSIVAGALLGSMLGLLSLKIRGNYFVIATFACQIVLHGLFNNLITLTGGPMGVSGIPRPTILGWCVSSHYEFLLLVGGFVIVVGVTIRGVVRSPLGRVLQAIREDEAFAESVGKDVARAKLMVLTLSSSMAAGAGCLYACYVTFIDPSSFTIMQSILIVTMVAIGGAGSLWGPFFGAFVIVMLPEALRFMGLPSSVAANLRQIAYGGLLVLVMMVRPRGLVGRYTLGR